MSEYEQWAEIMDENPVFMFLIQEKLVKLDLDKPDHLGNTGAHLTESGWRMAFEIMLLSMLQLEDPDYLPHPEELGKMARQQALVLLAATFRDIGEMAPEEIAEMKKRALEEYGMSESDEESDGEEE